MRASTPGRTPPRPAAPAVLAALVLAAILLVGWAATLEPFTWDQAVFALGADVIARGGTLYRDFWDVKQPGIFWFFALAGRLFGRSEAGAHALEAVWMLALAALLQRATRRWFRHAATAALCPLLVVGFYYAVADDWHLLQVEGLVGLPLFAALAAAVAGTDGARPRALPLVASGLAGGVALVFKLALLPVPAAFWLVALAALARGGGRGRAATAAGWIALGAALPPALALASFAARGALGVAWWTWTAFPLGVLGELPGLPVHALHDTLHWLVDRWAALIGFALLGGWSAARRAGDVLGRGLLAWLAAGVVVVLGQRWSGYQYHAFLLLVPLGLLAARGLEQLALAAAPALEAGPRARGALLATACAVCLADPLLDAPLGFAFFVHDGAGLDPARREAALERRSRGGAYAYYQQITDFLHDPGSAAGPIYVFGNPLAYWLSGRPPAARWPGGMSVLDAAAWREVAARLDAGAAAYVLIEDPAAGMLEAHRPATAPVIAALERRYRRLGRVRSGTWYARADSLPAPR